MAEVNQDCEIRKSYYAVIPANIRYNKNLKANEKLLYGEITSLCNEKGYCWASNQYFAELYGVSKETVSRWISNLVNQNFINVEIRYKHNSREIDQRIIFIENQYLLTKTSRGIDENINDPIDENIKENIKDINNKSNTIKKKKETEYDELINRYTDNKELKNTIYEFIKMRKTIKAPLTTRALDLMLKKLESFTSDVSEKIKILNQSIEKSWRGIFKLKQEATDNTSSNNTSSSKGTFNNYDQRNYDYDDLEKKLLGWDK